MSEARGYRRGLHAARKILQTRLDILRECRDSIASDIPKDHPACKRLCGYANNTAVCVEVIARAIHALPKLPRRRKASK